MAFKLIGLGVNSDSKTSSNKKNNFKLIGLNTKQNQNTFAPTKISTQSSTTNTAFSPLNRNVSLDKDNIVPNMSKAIIQTQKQDESRPYKVVGDKYTDKKPISIYNQVQSVLGTANTANPIQPRKVYQYKTANMDSTLAPDSQSIMDKPIQYNIVAESKDWYYYVKDGQLAGVRKSDVVDKLPNAKQIATEKAKNDRINAEYLANKSGVAKFGERVSGGIQSVLGDSKVNSASTGNAIADTAADLIGTGLGYAAPLGGANTPSLMSSSNQLASRVVSKMPTNTLAQNVGKRFAEGVASTAPISLYEGAKENLSGKELAKKVATESLFGGLIGGGAGAFSALSKGLKKPLEDLVMSNETIPLEEIKVNTKVTPKSIGTGKLSVKNTEFENIANEYNAAILMIQNHFGTNQLRGNELAWLKSPQGKRTLGIDLDDIVNRMENAESKKIVPTSEESRLKRAAGVTSQNADTTINKVIRQEPNPNVETQSKTVNNATGTRPASAKTLQNIVDNPDKYNPDMVARAKNQLDKINKSTSTKTMNAESVTNKSKSTTGPLNKTLQTEQFDTVTNNNKTKTSPAQTGTSKFAQTVKYADTTDKAFAETIRPPEYTKVQNQKTWDDAVKNVKDNVNDVYNRITNKTGSKNESFTAQDTADAMALIDKYSREGNYTQAHEVLEKASKKLSEAGQTIQAASMWARQTPAGMLRYAENVVSKARKQMIGNDKDMQALVNEIDSLKSQITDLKANKKSLQTQAKSATGGKKTNILKQIEALDDKLKVNLQLFAEKEAKLPARYKDVKLTDADTEHIYKEQEAISKMAEGRPKTIRVAQLQAYIGKKVPSNTLQKVSTIQTIAQLLNPKTAIRNTVGNLGFASLEEGSNVLATGFDTLLSKITGQRTKAIGLDILKKQAEGFGKGFKAGVEDAKLGIDTSGFRSQYDLPQQTFKGTFKNTEQLLRNGDYIKAIKEGSSATVGALEKAMNVELKATDRAFYQAAFNRSIAEQMKVNKIKSMDDITQDMIENAHLDGLYKTFQDKNFLSKASTAIKRSLNGGKDFGIGDIITKYPKTPANMLMRAIDYSPIAIARSGIQLAKIASKLAAKEAITPQLQKQFVEGLSRATLGTGLFFLAGGMANLGIIQGKSPKDTEASSLMKEIGKGQYTLNLSALTRWVSSGFNSKMAKGQDGDKVMSYDWAQPTALTISAGANQAQQLKDKGRVNPMDVFGAIVTSLESGVDTLAEQPLLQGVSNIFKSNGNISDSLINTLTSVPASFVPTFVNQARQLIDNKSRVTKSDKNYGVNQAVNLVINKIPGLSTKLDEQVTTTGKTKEVYQNNGNKWYNVLFNPAFVSTLKKDEGINTILELYENTGKTTQFPRKADTYITINKKKLNLNQDQVNDLQKYVGQKTMEKLNKITVRQDFKKLSDDGKIKVIGKVLDASGKQGKQYLLNKLGSSYIKQNLK